MKIKDSEKKDKYLHFAKQLKKLWNMRLMLISIVVGAFGTVPKGVEKRLEEADNGGRTETVQIATLLRTARILKRVLET